MEERPVGADSIRPNPRISGSTQVNVHATVAQNRKHIPFIKRHPLSQPVRAASSPRGGAESASRLGATALLKHLFPLMDDDFFWLIVIIAKEHTCAILQFVEISLIFSQKHLHFGGCHAILSGRWII